MNERPLSSPRLLIVDDESDLRQFLHDLLVEEGYVVDLGATLDEALTFIDSHVYHLILTDLLAHSTDAPLRSALVIHAHARPTPVVALTGWNVSARDVASAGLTRLIAKPFDLTELLAAVASSVVTTLNAEQQRQAKALHHFCAALNTGDIDSALAVCDDTVCLYSPEQPSGEPPARICGRAACQDFLDAEQRARPNMRLDDYTIYPQAGGLALRYLKTWSAPTAPGARARAAGAITVQFSGERINQIHLWTRDPSWNDLPYSPDALPGEQDHRDE
jgi:CheY-like chemotaxis protein